MVARLTAERLQSALKQNFIVENQPAPRGTAAPDRVAKATPDGYTLISTPIFQLTTAKFAQNVTFEAQRDFKPISASPRAPFAITVGASFPGNTLAEFIAHVKANPGKLTFGSAGVGSTTHVAAVLVLKAAGLDMIHVPYRGVAPAFTDLLAGSHRDGGGLAGRAASRISNSGKLKPLAVARHQTVAVSAQRAAGDRHAQGLSSGGDLQRPARTRTLPQEIVGHAVARAGRGRQGSGIPAASANVGLEPLLNTPDDFAKIIAADMPRSGTASWPASISSSSSTPHTFSMAGSKADARVVIVGAGPVGMVCALALNRRGVAVTVLEQEPAPVEDQRAASLHPSTLEMLDDLGVTGKIIPLGLISTAYRFHDRVIIRWSPNSIST